MKMLRVFFGVVGIVFQQGCATFSIPGDACAIYAVGSPLHVECIKAANFTVGQMNQDSVLRAQAEADREKELAVKVGILSAIPGSNFSVSGTRFAKEFADGSVIIITEDGREMNFPNRMSFSRWQNPWRRMPMMIYPSMMPMPMMMSPPAHHHWRH